MPHTHEVQYVPPQVDPATGKVVAPATWVVLPSDHVHELKEVPAGELPKDEEEFTDEDVVSNVYQDFQECVDYESDSMERFAEAERFFIGEQWTDTEKQALKAADRACLTINVTQKHALELSGYQRENRQDLVFQPTENGDQRVADMYTAVAKHVLEKCYFWREEAKVFLDEMIGGRGLFNIYVDYSKKLDGSIVVERFPWAGCRFGPHEKEDASDCEVMFKDRWFSKYKLKQLFPKKAVEIENDYTQMSSGDFETTTPGTRPDDYPKTPFVTPRSIRGLPLYNSVKKEYRLLERWRRCYHETVVLVCPECDFTFPAFGWSKEDVDQASSLPGFVGVPRTLETIRVTKVAGGILLSDESPADLPVSDFFVVPAYALKRDDRFWGKIEQAMDSQVALNKRYSQGIDIGNKAINYGYYYDDGTFHTEQEREKFKKNVSKPGFVQRVMNAQQPPNRTEPPNFPGEVVNLMEVDRAQVTEMMNIQVEPQGANDSASKLMQLIKMKLKGNEYLFDGLTFAKIKVGRLLLPLIRKVWTPKRIYRLLSNNNAKSPVMVGGQPFEGFSEQEIVELLSQADVEEYDVSVAEISYSPTMRMAIFGLLSDLASKGSPIPPEVLIKFAGLPQDVETQVVEGIQQQNEMMAQGESEKANAEIAKTVIAKTGMVPPAVLEQLGMGQDQPPITPSPMEPGTLAG